MMQKEHEWMESQQPTTAIDDEESEKSQSSDDSCTEIDQMPELRHGPLPSHPVGQKSTIEHQTEDKHYLTVCATKNRVHGNHLSHLQQGDLLNIMENGKCIPTHMEQISQRDNYIQIVERVLSQNIPCLEPFKDVAVNHIPHMYSKETREPTESVSIDAC
jgi:hypothetical protein